MTELVFVSSSGDLAQLRLRISDALSSWLHENGFDQIIAPYLWEADKENGRLLSDRVPIQTQLPDPASREVPLTICLFGERCGVPLQDDVPPHWRERLAQWMASTTEPGLLHPWPHTIKEQTEALKRGAFPLTGTVFELLSAHDQDPEADNLVVAYTASRFVEDTTKAEDIDFNDRRLWHRLSAGTKSDGEREHLIRYVYDPQKIALLNLLKFLGRRIGSPPWYASLEEMERQVIVRAKAKLGRRFGIVSLRNPFKSTLEHWVIDDRLELPGREKLVQDICSKVEAQSRTFFLLKGRSGCGKSSLLQRGVLARLRDRGALTVPFRPTDLHEMSDGRDRLDILWQLIANEVGCHDRDISDRAVKRGRDKHMAERLHAVLDRRNVKLVIGLDQFEEVLDELNLFRDAQASPKGWWLVMKFLSLLASSPRVMLVATLEASREDTFLRLNMEGQLKLRRNVIDVDVGADDVEEIARQGFHRAGLPLAADVLEEIKRKWVEFERTTNEVHSASPLPLACLWFAGLYERFEDKAQAARPTKGFDAAASVAWGHAGHALDLADIGKEGIAFENVIQKLADEAWEAGGKSKNFESPIEADPQYTTLGLLLGPCIGLDVDGHKRLLSVSQAGADATIGLLRKAFVSRRLMVPVLSGDPTGGTNAARIRLVHQAVIDRWLPARQWFDSRRDYLVLEERLRSEATYWSRHGKEIPVGNPSIINDAAEVLFAHRADWTAPQESLSPDDRVFKAQVVAVFLHSETPGAIVGPSARRFTHAHLAANFHLVDLLKRFVASTPDCLHSVCNEKTSLLLLAAWSEGPAIEFLLDHSVPLMRPEVDWNAIEAAIQLGLRRNYALMIEKISDVDLPIGPSGYCMVHTAARYGNLEVLKDLKTRGADLGVTLENGRTALHWAASTGQVGTFAYLLHFVPHLAEDRVHGNTALGIATHYGHCGVIRAFLDSDLDDAAVALALTHKNTYGLTPLMLAAQHKHPDALRLLLAECDPRDGAHRTENEETLLHLAMKSNEWSHPSDDEKVRARKVAQILLEDGRIDPTLEREDGLTAFDVAHAYEDARRVIRRDDRMPRSYDKMTPKMRIDDLTSRQPAIVLDLLRASSRALTDRHDRKESGLDILLRTKNAQVLAAALKEGLITDELLQHSLHRLTELACMASAEAMRLALIRRFGGDVTGAEALPLLLNASIAAKDREAIAALKGKGAAFVRGHEEVGKTIFHDMAIAGQHEAFEEAAALISLPLPLDDWGRRPSDLAGQDRRRWFRDLEEKLFAAPVPPPQRTAVATKFHEYARRGDVNRFERQARGRGGAVPRDAEGKRPSEVAPQEHRAAIAALETRYFQETH